MPLYSYYSFKFHLLATYYVRLYTKKERQHFPSRSSQPGERKAAHGHEATDSMKGCHKKRAGCYMFSHSLTLPRRKEDQEGLHIHHPQRNYWPSKMLQENGS